ncbi:MAG: cyanophycin synthetase [bacterium]
MATYCETLDRLFALHRFGEKLDLTNARTLDARLGRPLGAYRSVIIGGTNGKGSTSAFLDAVLRARGLRVGLYTSPHLMSFRERIRVDGEDIDEATVTATAPRVIELCDEIGGSFFEASWALAARIFADAKVDVVVWEVGLGGRLDATNACDPEVSAVVSVGLDHMNVLGATVPAIAAEKAAIYRPGRPALTTAGADALPTLRRFAPQLEVIEARAGLPPLPLPGAHQRRNASLALAMAEAMGHPGPATDLLGVRWPGRAERIGDVVIDCAHNPHGATALAAWIDEAGLGPLHVVFGAMADKAVDEVAAILAPRAASVALVTPDYRRRLLAEDAARCFAGHPAVEVVGPVAAALDRRPRDRVTLVAGSCFLAGEARAHLLGVAYPECGIRTLAR